MKSRLLPLALVLTLSCEQPYVHAVPSEALPRPVSILVEVYDPITNMVWENVSVRVVEASHEWSGCTCVSPYVDWYLTDAGGQVLLDEVFLAYSEVGFLEEARRAAHGEGGFVHQQHVVTAHGTHLDLEAVRVEVRQLLRVGNQFLLVCTDENV